MSTALERLRALRRSRLHTRDASPRLLHQRPPTPFPTSPVSPLPGLTRSPDLVPSTHCSSPTGYYRPPTPYPSDDCASSMTFARPPTPFPTEPFTPTPLSRYHTYDLTPARWNGGYRTTSTRELLVPKRVSRSSGDITLSSDDGTDESDSTVLESSGPSSTSSGVATGLIAHRDNIQEHPMPVEDATLPTAINADRLGPGGGDDKSGRSSEGDDNIDSVAQGSSSSSSSLDEEDIGVHWVNGHKEYEVERILAHRIFPEATYFLVRWAGYSYHDDLWLPASDLRHARQILREYKDAAGLD